MYNQRLWGAPFGNPEETVRWFGVMQAQEYPAAKWAIGQRSKDCTDGTVEELYASRAILRTHLVRPTWHFVHRDDVRWVLEATRARVHQVNGTYYRKFGIDGERYAKSLKLFGKALGGGNELSRKELAEVLTAGGIQASGLPLGYILMRAELDAVIISGTVGGRAPTYALFDDRVPSNTTADPLAELARRYFTSRGPATVKDFVRWSSLTVGQARQGLERLGSEVDSLETGGRTYYFVAGKIQQNGSRIDLVQGYDEYVMSYSESKDVLQAGDPGNIDLNVYLHAVLLDGRVIGHWKHVFSPKEVTVEAAFYRSLTKPEKALMDAATGRFGTYFGLPATWVTAA
jgi:hypothetical protein